MPTKLLDFLYWKKNDILMLEIKLFDCLELNLEKISPKKTRINTFTGKKLKKKLSLTYLNEKKLELL